MRGKVNMHGIQESNGFKPLAEGKYTMRIMEINEKYTGNGDPMLSIKLVIPEGFSDEGKYVWDNIVIPGPNSSAIKILGRTKHFLHCLGEPYENEEGQELEWDSDNWKDKRVMVQIKHEPPNEYHNYIKPIVANYVLDEKLVESQTTGAIDLGDEPSL